MNPAILSVINDWRKSIERYSFETRLALRTNSQEDKITSPYITYTFIIEVGGFYYDPDHTYPIKLHQERTISIDNLNMTTQYVEDFRRDLELFTSSAYAYIADQLAGQQSSYTSDLKWLT